MLHLLLTSYEEYGKYRVIVKILLRELIGAISVAQCFRTQAGMLSGPGAFLVSTSSSNSWMPTVEIEMGGIVG